VGVYSAVGGCSSVCVCVVAETPRSMNFSSYVCVCVCVCVCRSDAVPRSPLSGVCVCLRCACVGGWVVQRVFPPLFSSYF